MASDRQTQTPTDEADKSPRPPVLRRRRALFAIVIPPIVTVTILLAAALTLPSCAGESTVGGDGVSITIGLSINAAGLNWVRVPIDEEGWLIPRTLTATPSGFLLFARPTLEYSWPPEHSGPVRRWESTNGLDWTAVRTDEEVFRPEENIGLVVGNRWGVIAMGVTYPPTDNDQGDLEFVIWTSEDGRSWQRTDWPSGGKLGETLSVGPPGYLVDEWRGGRSRVLCSSDGIGWDLVDLPGNVEAIGSAGFARGFVACGREFDTGFWPWLLLTSPDGRQWTSQSMDEVLEQHGDVTFTLWREEVVALVNLEIDDAFRGDTGMWRSVDGIEWTEMEGAPVHDPEGYAPGEVVSGGAGVLLIGQHQPTPTQEGVVWFSPNAEEWARATFTDIFGSGWLIARAAVGDDAVLVAIMADEEPNGEGDTFTLPPVEIWAGTPAS